MRRKARVAASTALLAALLLTLLSGVCAAENVSTGEVVDKWVENGTVYEKVEAGGDTMVMKAQDQGWTPTPTPTPTATRTRAGPDVESPVNASILPDTPDLDNLTKEQRQALQNRLQQAETTARDLATPDTEPAPEQPYTLEELQRNGKEYEEAPPSTRPLRNDGRVTGALALRRSLIGMQGGDSWRYVRPGETLHNQEVTIYGTRFGRDIDTDLTVHVVGYNVETLTRPSETGNGTVEKQFAVNVSEQQHQVELGEMYSAAPIPLPKRFDETRHISMWIEEYPDAKWTFEHRPSPAAASVNIQDWGDLMNWLFINVLIPALLALIAGAALAKKILGHTVTGPMRGWKFYLFLTGVSAFAVAWWYWFEAAVLITKVPYLVAGIIGLTGFMGYLETAGAPHRRVLFEKHELTEAKNAAGDEVQDALYKEVESHRVAKDKDGNLCLVRPGLFPFLARFFAQPAKIKETELATAVEIEGRWDQSFLADPLQDQVLDWRPARFSFQPQLFKDVPGDDDETTKTLNLGFLLQSGLSLFLGIAAGSYLGLPWLGYILGLLGVAAAATTAHDGFADWVPAPVHARKSMASLHLLQGEYRDAATKEEALQNWWQAESRNKLERMELEAARGESMIEAILGTDDVAGNGDSPNRDETEERLEKLLEEKEEDWHE